MTRVWTVVLLLLSAVPAWAGPGDPVVGQQARVDRHLVGVSWEGTEEDREHQQEAAALGGYTLFASFSPGGAVIARAELAWPPPPPTDPEESIGSPGFGFAFVPDGRYYIVVVRGIVGAPSVPAGAWSEVVVNIATCGAPPGAPVNLLGQSPIPNGTPFVSLGWTDGAGCPPVQWEIVAGYTPGASNAAAIRVPARVFQTLAPPGTYYVRVHALNQFGRSAPSNEVEIVVPDPTCIVPGAPGNLRADVQGQQVTLMWDTPYAGSRPITLYQISAGSMPALFNLANIHVGPNSTSFTTAAPPGRYYVRVHAGNGCGGTFNTGLPSNEIIIDVP